jgi:tetratricopeptide (TPR) repeat protein
MSIQDDIAQQQRLLATYRRTLAHYVSQQAMHGPAYTPPAVVHGIVEAREQIRQLKTALRSWSVAVEDLPGDEQSEMPATLASELRKGAVAALYQLRAAVSDFVGREHECEQIVQALSRAIERGAGAIGAIRGLGGIGKTELAYTVAQRLVPFYPDAQLVVELRGTSGQPLSPEQTIQRIIRAIEPQAMLPDDLSGLQMLYRSLLAGKRVLMLADDARDAAQVRPLLPPPGSVLLITSRQRFSLPGMVALDLGMLPQAEQMLLAICPRIGTRATQLAQLCGALPLALRVSAGLLDSDATRQVDRYIQALSGERARLAHLRDPDDPDVNVEASLALSYDSLDTPIQSALCQLSAFPASFDRSAAAAVVALPALASAEALENVLSALYRRSLLEYDLAADRFALHDLVRVFAAARLTDAADLQLRYAHHYVGVAQTAEAYYAEGNDQVRGLALFDQERVHIDAAWAWVQQQALSQSTDELILAYALATTYIGNLRYDKWHERIPQLEAAVAAARRQGAHDREGRLLNNLGLAYAVLGDIHQALGLYEQALAIAQQSGDRGGEGNALGNLAGAYADLGETEQAIAHFERSLAIKRETRDRRGEANTLNNLGLAYADLGAIDRAVEYYQQALAIAYELGDRQVEGIALGNLANSYAAQEERQRAIEYYDRSLVIKQEIGDRRGVANSSWDLGLLLAEQGDLERAAALMQICVDFEREVNHPDAEKDAAQLEEVRRRLSRMTSLRE